MRTDFTPDWAAKELCRLTDTTIAVEVRVSDAVSRVWGAGCPRVPALIVEPPWMPRTHEDAERWLAQAPDWLKAARAKGAITNSEELESPFR